MHLKLGSVKEKFFISVNFRLGVVIIYKIVILNKYLGIFNFFPAILKILKKVSLISVDKLSYEQLINLYTKKY